MSVAYRYGWLVAVDQDGLDLIETVSLKEKLRPPQINAGIMSMYIVHWESAPVRLEFQHDEDVKGQPGLFVRMIGVAVTDAKAAREWDTKDPFGIKLAAVAKAMTFCHFSTDVTP
jgi:hypothetical protein